RALLPRPRRRAQRGRARLCAGALLDLLPSGEIQAMLEAVDALDERRRQAQPPARPPEVRVDHEAVDRPGPLVQLEVDEPAKRLRARAHGGAKELGGAAQMRVAVPEEGVRGVLGLVAAAAADGAPQPEARPVIRVSEAHGALER